MRFEYDEKYDLLYIRFSERESVKVAKTLGVGSGVFVDLDEKGNPLGIEILDASEIIDGKIEFACPGFFKIAKKAVNG